MSYFKDRSNLITIVIPTFNRYEKLERLIRYYLTSEIKYSIIILDSSYIKDKNIVTILNEHDNFKYIAYDSNIFFADKVAQGLELVNTKYVVLNADDDFLIPETVLKATEFLENNIDFSVCQGKFNTFKEDVNKRSENLFSDCYFNMISIDDSKSINRFTKFLNNYYPVFYGVYRIELLSDIFRKNKVYTNDTRFSELLPAMLTSINGKIKILNDLYIVLEESVNSDNATTDNMKDFKRKKTLNEKVYKFKKCILEEFIKIGETDNITLEFIIDNSIKVHLEKKIPTTKQRIEYQIKRLFGFFKFPFKIKSELIIKSKFEETNNILLLKVRNFITF